MKEIMIITTIVAIGIIATSTALPVEGIETGNIEIYSLDTDKETYFSKENMIITLGITSKKEAEIGIEIKGIANKLNLIETKYLEIGNNSIEFSYTTPSCYGCAGISPGSYNITAYILCENKTYTSPVKWIEMVK